MYFKALMLLPCYMFLCNVVVNLPDSGQEWLKHVADDERMHSVLRVVFTPKINTDLISKHGRMVIPAIGHKFIENFKQNFPKIC
jgi:hypothetical protein